ncbi:ABC transporter substrate-binding protein [Paenibacillus nanensis]|nr:extracellular solute-binding protein [Paenibacillus nanensis]
MKQMTRIVFTALLVLTMMAVAACSSNNSPSSSPSPGASEKPSDGKSNEEKIKLRIMTITTDENRNNIMEQFIKPNIAKEFPNLEVEFEPGGGGEDMANKMKTYNASGDMPDIFWNDAGFFTSLNQAGNIMDLTSYITEDGFLNKYKVPEALKHFDGKIYSLSSGADTYFTPVIFYHKDLFEQAGVQVPQTFDELIEVSKKLKDSGIVPAVTQGKDGWGPKLFMLQQMVQIGDPEAMMKLVNNETDFNDPSVIAGVERIERLAKEGVFADGIANIDYGPAMEMFSSKQSAMLWMFTWELPNLAKIDGVDFFPFPSASDKYDPGKVAQFWGSPLNGYAVSAKTAHPDEAVKVAEFLAMQDALYFESVGSAIALETGNTASNLSPLMEKFLTWYNAAEVKIPSFALNSIDARMSAELSTQGARLLTGEYPAAEFLKVINQEWKENTWFD